ncbi:hypothetical protein N658DRAFT_491066 [Parathielavia hyrcaniae]|uniref:Uncharacterized protein n=1 Tax=Parathielavia hyrcaniae TaxID=113614 RepID=A0AAN6QCU9_9PEZI|nr:hypothetical protein N658DRAFT_491066 [Parathielavia hyrcaniae]
MAWLLGAPAADSNCVVIPNGATRLVHTTGGAVSCVARQDDKQQTVFPRRSEGLAWPYLGRLQRADVVKRLPSKTRVPNRTLYFCVYHVLVRRYPDVVRTRRIMGARIMGLFTSGLHPDFGEGDFGDFYAKIPSIFSVESMQGGGFGCELARQKMVGIV